MEDNVALDSNKQKDFVKSVKGIKKLIKKRNNKEKQSNKEGTKSVKGGKITKRRQPRGLVYLGHIPHGFYEHEMTQYFRQFGMVTNARVIRSKRTGNSKGYAFVEFKDPAVAQVVAETMNNYLMGKRLIKAAYIPPNKQRKLAKRKQWSFDNNPSVENRRKNKKEHNEVKTENKELHLARNMLSTLNKTKKKLREMGIDYDFFKPVDVPEEINLKQDNIIQTKQNAEKDEKNTNIKKESNKDIISKKKIKKEQELKLQKETLETRADSKKTKKEKNSKSIEQNTKAEGTDKKEVKKTALKQKDSKSDDVIQKQKRQSLKDSNVKLLEDFININEDDGDSDGSLEFDSDEFEKAMGEDDSVASSDESDEPLDSEITSNDEEEEKVQKIVEVKPKPVVAIKKAPKQKNVVPPKKGKFEKQTHKKTLNKVIKKKK